MKSRTEEIWSHARRIEEPSFDAERNPEHPKLRDECKKRMSDINKPLKDFRIMFGGFDIKTIEAAKDVPEAMLTKAKDNRSLMQSLEICTGDLTTENAIEQSFKAAITSLGSNVPQRTSMRFRSSLPMRRALASGRSSGRPSIQI